MKRARWLAFSLAAALLAAAAIWLASSGERTTPLANSSAPGAGGESSSRPSDVSEPPPTPIELAPERDTRVAAVSTANAILPSPAEPPSKARFRGRLVYASNHDPVPWCIVAIRAPDTRGELRVTDEDGHFATGFEYEAGPLSLLADDAETLPRDWSGAQTIEHSPAIAAEHEMAVDLWPTCIFEGDLPPGVDVHRLKCTTPSTWMTDFAPLRKTKTGVVFLRVDRRSLVGDNGSTLAEIGRLGPPWTFVLRVESANPQGPEPVIAGVAKFPRFEGVVRAQTTWTTFGAVELTFRTGMRVPPDWPIGVQLRLTSGRAPAESRLGASLRRAFTMSELLPGSYEFSIDCDFCEKARVEALIEAGKTTRVEVPMQCQSAAGAIHGVITSESGHYNDPRVLVDFHPGHIDFSRTGEHVLWRQRDGRWIGEFESTELPAGDYWVCVRPRPYAVRPDGEVAVHPGDTVEFHVLDVGPRIEIGFRVFERDTGVELDEYDLGSYAGYQRVRSGEIAFHDVTEDGELWWHISKCGYTDTEGELSKARASWAVEGSQRWIRVELARGKRFLISVVKQNNEPLAGATILVDGVVAGTTDDKGLVRIAIERCPSSVGVRYRDWRYCAPSHALTGDELDRAGNTRFVLEPAD
jgi:hypothetical protein